MTNKDLLFRKCECFSYLKSVHDGVCIERVDPKDAEDGEEHYVLCKSGSGPRLPYYPGSCDESPCEGSFDLEKTYYKKTEKNFVGVCVGFRDIVTEGYLGVDTITPSYGDEQRVVFKEPKTAVPCALVYFGSNMKRWVPIEDIILLREGN